MKTSAAILSILLVAAVLILAGCDSGKKSNSNNNGLVCQAGTAYVPQFNGCYSTNGCQPNYAYVPQVGQCYPTSTTTNPNQYPQGGYYSYNWRGQLSISNYALYQQMLKEQGVCDVYMWNYGYASCDNWPATANVQLQTQSLDLNTRGSVAIMPQYSGFYSTTIIPFSEILRPINNNTQWELRTMGYWQGYNAVFSAIGNSPTLKDASGQPIQQIQLNISYRGGALGTAYVTFEPYYYY